MNALDREIRAAFEKIADVPPPPGLADEALRRAARPRAVDALAAGRGPSRRALFAVAVATAVAAIAVPVTLVATNDGPQRAPQPATTATQSPRPTANAEPYAVVAYGGLGYPTQTPADRSGAAPASTKVDQYSLVLDSTTGRYVKLADYYQASAAPDGTRLVVIEGKDWTRRTGRIGIMERASREVHWLGGDWKGYGEAARWSADSGQLLLQHVDTPTRTTLVIVDAATRTTKTVPVDLGKGATFGGFIWAPDGREVVTTVLTSEPAPHTELRRYDLTGRLTGSVQVRMGIGPGASFSPDGRRLFLEGNDGQNAATDIVDVSTGAVVATLPGHGIRGWRDDGHLIHVGQTLEIVDLTGHVTQSVPLVPEAAGNGVAVLSFGPARGLPPDAAAPTF